VLSTRCFTWIYQNQSNGICREVYNALYSPGENVKVCCSSHNVPPTIVGKCTGAPTTRALTTGAPTASTTCAPITGAQDPCPIIAINQKEPCDFALNVLSTRCFTWIYQNQSNGICREVYNALYSPGENVKVCCSSTNVPPKIVGKCAPPTTGAPTSVKHLTTAYPTQAYPTDMNPNDGTRSSPSIVLVSAVVLFTSMSQIGGGIH